MLATCGKHDSNDRRFTHTPDAMLVERSAPGGKNMDDYAWHDPLMPDDELEMTEGQNTAEFNSIMSESSPKATAESFEDFVWTNDPPEWER